MYHFPGRYASIAIEYTGDPHIHSDTDTLTMRNLAAYYCKGAACLLWI